MLKRTKIVLYLTYFAICYSHYVLCVKPKYECGYKQCPVTREGALNVHLIPHSHMDAGWVKTFDEYYYGTKTTISTANVQLIYHSVLSELLHDKRRKFTFSETAYFWRWWKEQRPVTRATFRTLVQEGRLEFAGGGWVQNDEATADYLQIIDQYTWGLRKLNDTLGPCGKPKAAWQIDTYGHTREQASLLAQMGYDGLFIGRVDHKEREAMIEEDRMEFMWRGSDVLGKMSDIMTHTLFNLYNAPDGFCFDFLCNDEPIVDDPDNKEYNADRRVNDFIAQIEKQAKYYDHDNIIVTMGGDFTYQSAANWFMNMDKLINHVNSHPANLSDINIFYSSPSCYLKALYLYGRRDKAIYTEKNDHLPYGSDASTYWTGFYTSRPSLKYLARRAHAFLQVVKQLTVISRMGDSYELHLLRHAVSLVLHHDAITGSSQQHVTNDFIKILSEAVEANSRKVGNLISYLTPTWGSSRRSKSNQQFVVCHQLNISQCRFLETQETTILLVYNPLSVKTYHHIRLPAVALHYSIRDFNDEEVEYQLVPLPTAIINMPGRSSTSIQEFCFEAENIPPLGYSAYYITPIRDPLEENSYTKKQSQPNPDTEHDQSPQISNEYIKVTVDKDTGLLESIHHVDGVKIQMSQNFHYYSQQQQQAMQSGAYSFRPHFERPVAVTDKVAYTVVRGSIVKEIRQRFTDWITQVIRLYRGEEFVELEWIVGPIPIGTDLGKEVVSIFSTNITNNGEFFTDSNGRQMMKRSCWNESTGRQQKKPVSSCYYPVTSRICIHSPNSSVEMCVLTDRPQGGTSYNEGEIEMMVHRRLLTDDGFGLEESLNEEAYGVGLVVKGRHRIIFGNYKQDVDDQTFSERVAASARKWLMEPWLFFTSGDKVSRRKWQNIRNKRFSPLRLHGLPRHIHVLTLEPWKAGSVLLRLENTLEKPDRGTKQKNGEGPEEYNMKPSHITVELRKIFLQMQIKMVRETTLAGNQWLDDARQMDWSTRYVYNGADDGILPEDNIDYGSDRSAKTSDAPYSDEEQDYTNKKQRLKYFETNRSRGKTKQQYDERRKRSVFNTKNVKENILNGTFNGGNVIKDVTTHVNEKKYDLTTAIIDEIKNKTIVKNTKTTEAFKKDATTVRRLGFIPKKAIPHVYTDLDKDSVEVGSSEEDFSGNLKRNRKKDQKGNLNRSRETEILKDDKDDGITKSIYDMYYKSRPKLELKQTQEDLKPKTIQRKSRRYNKQKNYRDSTAEYFTDRRGRRNYKRRGTMFYLSDRRTMKNTDESSETRRIDNAERAVEEVQQDAMEPLQVRAKRRRESYDSREYDTVSSEEENDRDDRRPNPRRMKRSILKDDEGQEPPNSEHDATEPDYVVTLRPTQIRTFVIWFESKSKV